MEERRDDRLRITPSQLCTRQASPGTAAVVVASAAAGGGIGGGGEEEGKKEGGRGRSGCARDSVIG